MSNNKEYRIGDRREATLISTLRCLSKHVEDATMLRLFESSNMRATYELKAAMDDLIFALSILEGEARTIRLINETNAALDKIDEGIVNIGMSMKNDKGKDFAVD